MRDSDCVVRDAVVRSSARPRRPSDMGSTQRSKPLLSIVEVAAAYQRLLQEHEELYRASVCAKIAGYGIFIQQPEMRPPCRLEGASQKFVQG